jgi:hypothetical protein
MYAGNQQQRRNWNQAEEPMKRFFFGVLVRAVYHISLVGVFM